MSTSMVDLSSLNQVNFGGGQTGYQDPSTGQVYDSGGNPLSGSDLAAYGSYSVSSVGSAAAPPPGAPPAASPPVVSGSGNGAALAGMSGLFSGIGAAITNATRPATITPAPGSLVYNPATGGYTTPAALTASSAINPLLLLVLGAAVIWLIIRETE
jgi:hypothetical protein